VHPNVAVAMPSLLPLGMPVGCVLVENFALRY
jgi:hypothetical protein